MIPGFFAAGAMGQGGGPSGDPHWGNVSSLLHFDGTDGATTFVDDRGNTWSRTGTARLSTARARFGPSSLLLPNSSFIQSPTALGAGVGSGDFTIEGFFYAVSQSHRGLLHTELTGSAAGIAIGHENTSGGQWQVYFGGSVYQVSSMPLVLNAWQHFALVRVGTACRLYINGVQVLAFTSSANIANTGMVLGCYYNSSFAWGGGGNVDEVRLTTGVARYTSNFTPPSAPFPGGP